MNPQGLVPALVTDDGDVLTQSLAIIEWLDETLPAAAVAAAGRRRAAPACARSRSRSPATSTRSTTCACCNYLTGTLGVDRGAEGRLVPVLVRRRSRSARDAARARARDRHVLPWRRADARRHLPRAAARQCAARRPRSRAVSDAVAHRVGVRGACRRSRMRRRRDSPTRNNLERHRHDRRPAHLGSSLGADRRPAGALSGPPHLLRRPQLRRAREGNGRRCEQGAAVLLHQAGGRRGAGRAARRRSRRAIRSRRRTSITRSSSSSRSAAPASSSRPKMRTRSSGATRSAST